jgi:hypothetical protein
MVSVGSGVIAMNTVGLRRRRDAGRRGVACAA